MASNLKNILLKQVIEHLQAQLEQTQQAADAAHQLACHDQSKPENQYDTLALEAAYLAHGQSERALQLQQSLIQLQNFHLVDFSDDDEVAVSALLQVRLGPANKTVDKSRSELHYFILPQAGGVKVSYQGTDYVVLTPSSPIAQKMLGKCVDDEFQFNQQVFSILLIC